MISTFKSNKPAASHLRRIIQHCVEPLEARIAPATITFQGNLPGGTYSWHDGASWIGGVAPGAGDDVIIDAANRSMIVTITQPVSVNSITMASDEALSVSSTFTLAANSVFGSVTVTGAGTFTPGGGESDLVGTLVVGGGATLGGRLKVSGLVSLTSGEFNLAGKLRVSGEMLMTNAYFDFVTAAAELIIPNNGDFIANTGSYSMRNHGVDGTPVGVTVETGGRFQNEAQILYVDVPMTVNGGSVLVNGGTLFTRATATLNSPSITVASGGIFDISSGGSTMTVNGMVTGTGAGVVRLDDGTIAGGTDAVLNFVPGQFQVSGGAVMTGAFSIPASSDISIVGSEVNLAGQLSVSGKFKQQNAYVDFTSATASIRVLSGGAYEANTGGYVVRDQSGSTAAGLTIESGAKFVSSGGTVFIDVPIKNQGLVHAQGGTIGIRAGIFGLQAGTLSGGKWIIDAGRSMSISGGTITTNAADVEISGTFSGFAPTSNSGTLSYRNGADFTSGVRFTNSGTLSLGPGSVMTVAGFTQTGVGRVEFQIDGFNAANTGRIVSSQSAVLAGEADISIVTPFAPQGGTNYSLMQYPSKTGDFSSVTGLYLGHEKVFESFTEATSFRLNTTIDAGDLSVTAVTNPSSGIAGQSVTINYTVQNVGAFAIPSNTWFDAIYLSADATLDASDLLVQRLEITNAMAQNATYSRNVTAQLSGALPGDFHVFVVTDSRGLIADANRSNNAREGTTLALDVPVITEGTVLNGVIADGQDLYFRVNMPAEKGRSFTLDTGAASAGGISVAFANVPTRFGGLGFSADSDNHQEVLIPGGSAGEFYIRVHGKSAAGAGTSFSLLADALDLSVKSSSTKFASNIVFPTSPTVTTTVTGLEFSGNTTFSLVGGATIPATKVVFKDSTTAYVTFNLQGHPLGNYSLRADDGVANGTLPNAMQIVTGNGGTLDYNISSPTYIRAPFPGVKVTITYTNTGLTDLPAPYFTLIPENAELKLENQTSFVTGPIGILGVAQEGLAGIIAPGASYKIEIPYRAVNATQGGRVGFTLQVLGNDVPELNWDLLEEDSRPAGVPVAGWSAAFANFKASVGTSVDQFHSVLVDNANYLSQFGKVGYDVNQLLGFELQQADDFGEISGRFIEGKFGFGRLGPFEEKITVDAIGNVSIGNGEILRSFVKTGPASYRGVGIAETGTLTHGVEPGTFILTEQAGAKTKFRADGQIEYMEDVNGQRITGGYDSANRLETLTNSMNGDVSTFTYIATAAGSFIRTVTDPVGRVTTYSYNATGDVTSIETPQGTTLFTYDTTPHAPKTVTARNGVVTSYTYNAEGRVETETIGEGVDAITKTFYYDSTGKTTITDDAGETVQIFRNLYGAVGRVIDSLGNISTAGYDAFGRPVGATDANGSLTSTTYSGGIRPSEIQLGDGTKLKINFDAKNLLTSITSPGGDSTGYGYDTAGNPTSVTQADGTTLTLTYYPNGRVHTETASTGIVTTYNYNAAGLVSRKDFSTGGFVDFDYDARRNLETATDAEGTTTFTYTANDLVESVAYPNGKTITFTYDSRNRRETISEGGFTVRYAYDSLGRLDTLRDTANALIVDYGYDSLGRLESEMRGNGASTTYGYDAAGRVEDIIHRDAANATIEQFHYEYDGVGRVSSVTSNIGTTVYSYDAKGQLVGAQLPGGRNLVYNYDVDGNRTSTSDNGVPVTYSPNIADQYTAVGSKSLSYDSSGSLSFVVDGTSIQGLNYDEHGRLISFTEGANTTSYDYDALGNRIGVITNGVRTDFAIDPSGFGNVFNETTGGSTKHYANGLGLVGAFGASGTSYYHFDRLGNTAALTGATSALQNTYTYLPFGEVNSQTGTTANRFTFGGALGVQDEVNDTFYMRARYYDAELGRFTQRDPIGINAGDFNFYRYTQNSPVNRADPSGLDDFYVGAGGELTAGGGFSVQGGGFLSTNGFLDSGLFLSGSVNIGINAGVSVVAGYTPDLSGTANSVNYGAGAVTGSTQLDDDGRIIGQNGGVSAGLPGGASFSTGYGAKITPRAIINAIPGVDIGEAPVPPQVLGTGVADRLAESVGRDPVASQMLAQVQRNSPNLPRDEQVLEAIRLANQFRQENPESANNYFPKPKVQTESITIGPRDPNQIIGPAGFGAEPITGEVDTQPVRFGGWVKGGEVYPYTILFENKPDATAPAQIVTVTQTLDSDLDLTTFELGSLGWSTFEVTAPKGLTSWQTRVDATATLGVFVDIDAALNPLTRELKVVYTSIDPLTGDVPTDPFAGFLRPNVTAPEGDGFLTYSVKPLANIANDTEITAVASIVFDYEAPLSTPTLTNKVDTLVPNASVNSFLNATSTRGKFRVTLTGADQNPGSGFYVGTVFVRDNGGELRTVGSAQESSDFLFTGGLAGHTYEFFGIGTDNAGNQTSVRLTPDATISVIAPTILPVGKSRTFTDSDGDTYTVKLSGPGTLGAVLLDPDGDTKGSLDQLFLTGSTAKTKVTVTVKKAKSGSDGIVTIGDINVTGDLGAFTAKASDFTVDGVVATGAVGKVTVRDFAAAEAFVAVPGIVTGGLATSKLKLSVSARNIGDGFSIKTPTGLVAISATEIGDGIIAAATLGKLTTKAGMDANLDIAGAVGTVTITGAVNVGQWSVGSIGAVTVGGALNADIDATTTIKSVTVKNGSLNSQITANTIGAVSITGGDLGGFIGSSAPVGKVKGLGSFSIAGGNLTGSVLVTGNVGGITVKESKTGTGGAISGDLTAHSFGKIGVSGGNVTGDITATATALALGKSASIASLSITGGDLAADVRALGAVGAVAVKADKAGLGGNLDAASIVAAKIAAITVAKNIADSILLAGASFGADGVLGGTDDTFAPGTIGAVNIGGDVSATTIGAGLSTTNAILKDADDILLGTTPKITSTIASLIIKGTADPASYFATGKFATAPKIGTSTVDPTTDARFKVA
jgi:RHS repeat-associated protein